MSQSIHKDLKTFYNHCDEKNRLSAPFGELEFLRTQSILKRHLPKPPAIILDMGGAAGKYGCWLAELGYEVHLVDPVPLHIEQANEASKKAKNPISSITLGDARKIDFKDHFADVVLLMGPLYHLQKKEDRQKALTESYRVLKNKGHLFAAGISRFASTIDGLCEGYYKEPEFQKIMENGLKTGLHYNPTQNPLFFTDTFFHHPEELEKEISEANFKNISIHSVEGIGYMMKDFKANWNNTTYRQFLLQILEKIETEPSLLGASPHLMSIAQKLENPE